MAHSFIADQPGRAVLFYDGVCGLCDRAVQCVLRHDSAGRFRFAALQSDYARRALARHGRDARDLDTMCLLLDPDGAREQLLIKSDGVLAVLHELGGPWRLATAVRILPRAWRDRAYDAFVRQRYAWFGRYDQCRLPRPEERARFIDADAPARQSAG